MLVIKHFEDKGGQRSEVGTGEAGLLIGRSSCSPGWASTMQAQMKGRRGKFPWCEGREKKKKKRKIKHVLLGESERERDEKTGSKSLKAGETCY